MVDTARSLTSLQTLFADNTTGDISEQDLRDFLVTSLMQTSTTTAVTTADITGAIGQVYNLDLSGLTAERNLTLPVASAGDMIQVNVTAGDADYELVIKGVATVTINGGSTATEWSRLFIDGESATFRATSTTDWQVVNDGRIQSNAMFHQTVNQSISASTYTKINMGAVDYATGLDADLSTDLITIRRDGLYSLNGQTSQDFTSAPTDSSYKTVYTIFDIDETGAMGPGARITLQISGPNVVSGDFMLSKGQTVALLVFQSDASSTRGAHASYFPYLKVRENL